VLDDGGKGSNQAMAAGRLGARTTFIGVTGIEPVAESGVERLRAAGVVTSVRRSATSSTGVSIAIVDDRGMSMIVTDLGANRELNSTDLDEAPFSDHAVTLLQFECPVGITLDAARRAKQVRSRAIVTPGPFVPLERDALQGIDVIAPNQSEAAALLDVETIGSAKETVSAIRDRWGVENVVLTRGAEGSTLLWNDAVIDIPAFQVEARNTIGAGDGYIAAFAAGLAWSLPVEDAARLAAATAAISVSQSGAPWASYPKLGTVTAFLASRGDNDLARRIDDLFSSAARS
jgi:ribokinase